MSRAEKATEPSMAEILASIRRIISEEPVGRAAPVPANASPAAAPVPAATKAVKPALDPLAARLAVGQPSADAARPAVMRVDPQLPVGAAPAAERAPGPSVDAAPAAKPSSPFGRIAEALGSERRGAQNGRVEQPTLPPIMREPSLPQPASEPRPVGNDTARRITSDLDDLLAEPQLLPLNVAPPPVDSPAVMAPASSSLADDLSALRREQSGGRVFARRSVDLGAIVPTRDEPAAPAPAVVEPATVVEEAEKAAAPAKATAQARAMDKMLSARIASAKVAPPLPEPLPGEPIVIAAMPMSPPVAEAAFADPLPPAVDNAMAAPVDSLEPSIIGDGLDDLMEPTDAQSALGMLAAGLAAVTPPPVATVAPPAVEVPSFEDVAPADDTLADDTLADDVPISIAMPTAPADPVAVTVAAAVADDVTSLAEAEPAAEVPAALVAPVPVMPEPPAAKAAPAERPAVSSAAQLPASLLAMVPPPVAQITPAPAPAPLAAVATASNVASLDRQQVSVRTIEDMVAELLRPMLREWLAENMPRMVEKALRIELAEGLKTVDHLPRKVK